MKLELRDIGIPPRPSILNDIDQEFRKDTPDFLRLARIISTDVALAAGLIKTTNSPFFGIGKKVATVHEALLLLGLKMVVKTISGLALQQTFKHVPQMERFWCASAATARVAGQLTRELGVQYQVRPEDAYTFALFRDCGIPVLMIPFPEYRTVLVHANSEQQRMFTEIEDGELGLNHATVGAGLAHDWHLPEELCEAILYHHDLSRLSGELADALPPKTSRLIAIAQLAEHLIQTSTGLTQNAEWEKLGACCLRLLELEESDIPRLTEACAEVIAADY